MDRLKKGKERERDGGTEDRDGEKGRRVMENMEGEEMERKREGKME